MKKIIFSLALAIPCLANPISVNASNADFTYEEVTPVQEYAIERGIYTDRFLFYNGPSHPIHYEGSAGYDMCYVDYLKNASNIQIAYAPWTYYYSNIESGRCLGMSLTSILAHNGVFSPSDIQEGKERMIDIEPDMDYSTMINDPVIRKIITYQMRQDRPDFWLSMHQHFSEYDESETVDNLLETAQKAHDEGKYFLVILDDGDSQFSHAVTALGLIDGEWEYEGEKYDKCIPIYDTNLLHRCEDGETISYGCADDCSLFVNSETKKMYLPMYFEDLDVGKNFKIFSLDDEDFMNYKGAINPSESYNIDVEGISSVTIKNYDKEYNLSVTREDGTVFDGISDCKRIFANKGKEYVFKGKDFKVQNTANAENFGVHFMDINHAVHTDFQGAVNNIFYNSDEFNFDVSAPTEYDISLIFEEDSYKFSPHYKFNFSGNTDSDFKATQTDRGVILSSSDGLECQVKINDIIRDEQGFVSVVYTQGDSGGLSVNAEEKVQYEAISTFNNVLLTFDDNGNLAYYIGENYDARVQKGDVNCDGFIDAVDATQILIAYSKNSTDSTAYVGKTLGDYKGDGFVDAVDSSLILAKYAELSTT
ncbi:MAG: hypothetical protein K2J40_01410 [Ruminococcus sp.]|nr:hypothetical protein [Ruminococcus sp.]